MPELGPMPLESSLEDRRLQSRRHFPGGLAHPAVTSRRDVDIRGNLTRVVTWPPEMFTRIIAEKRRIIAPGRVCGDHRSENCMFRRRRQFEILGIMGVRRYQSRTATGNGMPFSYFQ